MKIRYIAELVNDRYSYPIAIDNKSQVWVDNLSAEGRYLVKVLSADGYVYQLMNTTDETAKDELMDKLNTAIAKLACINVECREPENRQSAADEYDVKDYVDDYETSSKYGEEWYD